MTPPGSVLVYVGLDLVGDGLMKLPFLRALRAACPDAKITWCAGLGHSVFAGPLQPLVGGLLDEVVENAGIGKSPKELFGPRPLIGRDFDLVIDTQRRLRPALAIRRVRHKRFVSAAGGFLLSHCRPKRGSDKPKAMVAQMLALLDLALGARAYPTAKPLPLPSMIEERARAMLPDGLHPVALAPGAGGKHKCWPLDYYQALASRLSDSGATPIFILGPDEVDWAEPLQNAGFAVRMPGSVVETIALSRLCQAGVSNDCGTGHMFAAADLPMVSLFGPTSPDKFAPAANPLILIQAGDYGDRRDMSRIPVAAAHGAVMELIG